MVKMTEENARFKNGWIDINKKMPDHTYFYVKKHGVKMIEK